VTLRPAHVDPTIAYHERLHVTDGPGLDARVVETWPIDLRGW
jgi:D-serine deaminase-like pyridoxal phosphate-dependent protein